jgi:hypothetical protein
VRTIEYRTGRSYDTPQVLKISIESSADDDFGFSDVVATFRDDSRHICGRVNVLVTHGDVGGAVLAAYDAGQYEPV